MKENFLKGIFKENPILVSMLGFCPTLAITTKLENAIGMGLAVIFVLVMSNLMVSLVRNITPDEIRIPVYIVIIASFVTIVDMVMEAFLPGLHSSLGVFIPLIVVNCIILGRAEAFASKNGPLSSIVDGLGMGIGFTLILALFSIIREILGVGMITVWKDIVIDINSLFGAEKLAIFSDFFVSPPGAFIVIGFVFAIVAAIQNKKASKAGEKK
ncbi:MAG TPA: electron transport complex subunit E [Acholeplasmataceae bacterium]|jgi:electron transport complex protein RnfE|nr:electron transport complex subunit E [Acholeplasmataceae bacterium]